MTGDASRMAPALVHLVPTSPSSSRMAGDLDVERIRADYGKATRAWHVAWTARVEWHRTHVYPLADHEQELLYDYVLRERDDLRVAEEKAYDRFVAARDVLTEALRTLGAD